MDIDNKNRISLPWITELEKRIYRAIRHLLMPWKDPYLKALTRRPWGWAVAGLHYLLEFPMLVLDVFGFPEVYGYVQRLLKADSRPLDTAEYQTAHFLFKNYLDLNRVRIDENALIGTHGGKYAYVSYFYINCSGQLTLPVLMHELAHILQYVQIGSPYIFRNLMAHWSKDKYNYGGLPRLIYVLQFPETLHQLNYEQRADIVSDYYLIASGYNPEWGSADHRDASTYLKVLQKVFEARP
ncbi:MAG: hypothetical protein SH818_07515 [Saprospiraceae bacterium]|nr:hypothetical protein [Saprospiraceae bacterium]